MKTHFLFPNQLKKLGWILFISSLIISLLLQSNIIHDYTFVTLVAVFGPVIGGILVGFSKLKIEDEYTTQIRYESLVWATYFNYGIIMLLLAVIDGWDYIEFLFYNTFTTLLFFIIRFHYQIYKLNKTTKYDE